MSDVVKIIKLQIGAGKANPSPPIGPALGQHGLAIAAFCQDFNNQTQDYETGLLLPVEISVFKDKTYSIKIKSPPAPVLIKKALNLESGSSAPNRQKVGKITLDQLIEIANTKMQDLNARNLRSAVKIIAGTAQSMGVLVEEFDWESIDGK